MFGKEVESRGGEGRNLRKFFFGGDSDGSSAISRIADVQRMLFQDTQLSLSDTSPVTNEDAFPQY